LGQAETVKPARVVLDTNCLVSALLFTRGRLAWLRNSWQSGRLLPLVSRDTVNELIRVLNYPKFKLERAEQDALLAEILPYVETVALAGSPKTMQSLGDPDDRIFIWLAQETDADALITGDADILSIRADLAPIRILTPSEFGKWLETRA
jgi:putative PIN family toxin of toxin-antitoxin system